MIRDMPTAQKLPWGMPPAEEAALRAKLEAGEIVLSSVLAQRAKVQKGDLVKVEINAKVQEFPVAGIVQDYMNGGLMLTMTTETALPKYNLGLPNWIILKTTGQPTAATQAAVAKLAEEYGWVFQSWADMSAILDKMLNGLVAALWALIVGGFVVGGLGIMNTLTMNILEQTREIGLLRVMGMSKKQTLGLVIVQVILIVTMGLFIGGIAGMTTAFVIDWVSMPLLAREVPFQLHYDLFVFNFGVCVLIALVSAILPAIRAVRVRMITAVAYE
jgi:putative ABC transport system permease protein